MAQTKIRPQQIQGNYTIGGRLTLATGDPVPDTDQIGGNTIYYTPYISNILTLYSGSDWSATEFAEISASLSGLTANTIYDVFIYDSSGTPTLELISWGTNTEYNINNVTIADPCVITYSSSTQRFAVGDNVCIQGMTGTAGNVLHAVTSVTAIATVSAGSSYSITVEISTLGLTYTSGGTVRLLKNTRTTAITELDNIPVKSGDNTRRYLGTMQIDGTGGQSEDSEKRRFIANYYNRVPRRVRAVGLVNSHTHSGTGSYELISTASSALDGAYRVSVVTPYNSTTISASWFTAGLMASNTNSAVLLIEANIVSLTLGTAIDATAMFFTDTIYTPAASDLNVVLENDGYNYIQKLIYVAGGNSCTVWMGGASPSFKFGLTGFIQS